MPARPCLIISLIRTSEPPIVVMMKGGFFCALTLSVRHRKKIEKARRISLVSDMTLVNVPLEKSRGFLFSLHGAVFETPFHMCYKSHLSRGTRGQKTRNFKKKLNEPLDTMTNVIYVARVITDATSDFVSASACNYPFGQGYAHQPYRRKSHDEPDHQHQPRRR